MARKFLYLVAALIVLVVAAGIVWSLFGQRLIRTAFIPSAPFVEQKAMPANVYADAKMWHARPDIPGNPALWIPPGFTPQGNRGNAAIFFIHPTSYLDRSAWNASLDDETANDRARLFIKGQASAFNSSGDIWAPKYRQATFGAFLTSQQEATRALNAAYADVLLAWDQFLREAGDRPIIIAGHSQGSLHLTRLIRERIAGTPVAKRIVAAYMVGWPVSIQTDLAALGMPACTTPDQTRCILSWQSFAEPADPSLVTDSYDTTTGFDGHARKGTPMVCTNPLTGTQGGSAPASANTGTLIPSTDLKTAEFKTGIVPARCDARGFLLIGSPPEGIGTYVLPGNNYHVFDYSLFWANVRSDAQRRLAAFEKR